jgi:AcrR family transcriptional regulator
MSTPSTLGKPPGKPPPRPRTAHHHGDLRRALITAGIELLEEGGLGALTLRRCAARAGVSHAAPAHHFVGLSGLLTAIVASGYEKFTETMIAERARAATDPRARLVAICNGYLRFAAEHGALFALMFSTQNINYDDAELITTSSAAYGVLAEACAPFRPGPAGNAGIEIMVWSLVHGYASLSARIRSGLANRMKSEVDFADILPVLELKQK